MKKPELLIVDENPKFREGLKSIISKGGYALVAGEADDEAGFLEILASRQPDMVIMDSKIPLQSGFGFLRKAFEVDPDLIIIVYSMVGNLSVPIEWINLGSGARILKSTGIQALETAIREFGSGIVGFSGQNPRNIFLKTGTIKTGQAS
jgi:DNA-binding NarL/FixJ family response regulator